MGGKGQTPSNGTCGKLWYGMESLGTQMHGEENGVFGSTGRGGSSGEESGGGTKQRGKKAKVEITSNTPRRLSKMRTKIRLQIW